MTKIYRNDGGPAVRIDSLGDLPGTVAVCSWQRKPKWQPGAETIHTVAEIESLKHQHTSIKLVASEIYNCVHCKQMHTMQLTQSNAEKW